MKLLLISINKSKVFLSSIAHEKSKKETEQKKQIKTWNQNVDLTCQGMTPFSNRGASGHTVIQRINSFWPH